MIIVFGSNSRGQLGSISSEDIRPFSQIKSLSDKSIASISTGMYHSAAIVSGNLIQDDDGVVYTWGSNDFGELGHKKLPTGVPHKVSALNNVEICSIQCGTNFTVALSTSGLLLTWGSNENSQLGLDIEHNPIPEVGYHNESLQQDNSYIKTLFRDKNIQTRPKRRSRSSSGNSTVPASFTRFLKSNNEEFLNKISKAENLFIDHPTLIEKLQNIPIVQISCGANHTIALAANGNLYGWGSNKENQVGTSFSRPIDKVSTPDLLRYFVGIEIEKIRCGPHYSTALSKIGELYVWGSIAVSRKPLRILLFEKIVDVACGTNHLLLLTVSGRVFVYCSKMNGKPVLISSLLGERIVQVSAGRKHLVAASENGNIYTFAVTSGSTNLANIEPTLLTKVKERIAMIESTENHTIILLGHRHGPVGRSLICTEGLEDFASLSERLQFQLLSSPNALLRSFQMEQWESYFSCQSNALRDGLYQCVRLIVLTMECAEDRLPMLKHFLAVYLCLYRFDIRTFKYVMFYVSRIHKDLKFKFEDILNDYQLRELIDILRTSLKEILSCGGYTNNVFDQTIDESLFNCMYLLSEINNELRLPEISKKGQINPVGQMNLNEFYMNRDTKYPLDLFYLDGAAEMLDMKLEYFHWQFSKPVDPNNNCIKPFRDFRSSLNFKSEDIEFNNSLIHNFTGKSCFSLCAFPFLFDSETKFMILQIDAGRKMFQTSNMTLFNSVLNLFSDDTRANDTRADSVDVEFTYDSEERNSQTGPEVAGNTLNANGNSIISSVLSSLTTNPLSRIISRGRTEASNAMGPTILEDEQAENSVIQSLISSVSTIFQNRLSQDAPLPERMAATDPGISINISRNSVSESSNGQVDSLMLTLVFRNDSPYFTLKVNRNSIFKDTISRLKEVKNPEDFKKPLRVVFENEEGLDEGGITKELFHLITKEMMNLSHGLFVENEESGYAWFNTEFNCNIKYIGVLFGLALYNSCVLNVNFPTLLFKKLLHYQFSYGDFAQLYPQLAKQFNYLLFRTDDVENFEDTFALYFNVDSVDLIPNGSEIAVTQANKKEYIYLYMEHLCSRKVEQQIKMFIEGFNMVCHGPVIESFHPEELVSLIRGDPNTTFNDNDILELRLNAQYKNGYLDSHPVVERFWEVLTDLNIEQRKRFFFFLTGSERYFNRRDMVIVIQRVAGSADRLPAAHTCFNILDLPEYETYDQMKQKLIYAIENTEGFGLV